MPPSRWGFLCQKMLQVTTLYNIVIFCLLMFWHDGTFLVLYSFVTLTSANERPRCMYIIYYAHTIFSAANANYVLFENRDTIYIGGFLNLVKPRRIGFALKKLHPRAKSINFGCDKLGQSAQNLQWKLRHQGAICWSKNNYSGHMA